MQRNFILAALYICALSGATSALAQMGTKQSGPPPVDPHAGAVPLMPNDEFTKSSNSLHNQTQQYLSGQISGAINTPATPQAPASSDDNTLSPGMSPSGAAPQNPPMPKYPPAAPAKSGLPAPPQPVNPSSQPSSQSSSQPAPYTGFGTGQTNTQTPSNSNNSSKSGTNWNIGY